ncbi:hypothetical protein [Rodentibacter caecimuris]
MAKTVNIKISEEGITSSYQPHGQSKNIIISSDRLNSIKSDENNEIANSVTFEVYKISEYGSEQISFESPSGICYGYLVDNSGVNIVDSIMVYLKKGVVTEYYGNVTGVNLTINLVSNVQFVPIYSISDPISLKRIREELMSNSRESVSKSIRKGRHILSNIICRERMK